MRSVYHRHGIVWFNVVVHARILSGFFTATRYGATIYSDIKFLAGGFPRRRRCHQETTGRIAFGSRLLKAANVVICFTTRDEVTAPRRAGSCFTPTTDPVTLSVARSDRDATRRRGDVIREMLRSGTRDSARLKREPVVEPD
jgi:hypothetical protein